MSVVALHAFVAAHAGPPPVLPAEREPACLARRREIAAVQGQLDALRAALEAEIDRQDGDGHARD